VEPVALGEGFAAVLAAAQTGAEWAMASLYRQYQPSLLRYLSARAGQDGEDIASAAWLDAARNLGTFDGGEDHFRRWLFTIANRRLTDFLRRRSRRSREVLDEAPDAPAGASSATADLAIAAIAGDDAARRIAAVLPPDQAAVVLLRVVAGFSVEEVAEILERRPGAIRVMSHRALRRLAEEFGDDV